LVAGGSRVGAGSGVAACFLPASSLGLVLVVFRHRLSNLARLRCCACAACAVPARCRRFALSAQVVRWWLCPALVFMAVCAPQRGPPRSPCRPAFFLRVRDAPASSAGPWPLVFRDVALVRCCVAPSAVGSYARSDWCAVAGPLPDPVCFRRRSGPGRPRCRWPAFSGAFQLSRAPVPVRPALRPRDGLSPPVLRSLPAFGAGGRLLQRSSPRDAARWRGCSASPSPAAPVGGQRPLFRVCRRFPRLVPCAPVSALLALRPAPAALRPRGPRIRARLPVRRWLLRSQVPRGVARAFAVGQRRSQLPRSGVDSPPPVCAGSRPSVPQHPTFVAFRSVGFRVTTVVPGARNRAGLLAAPGHSCHPRLACPRLSEFRPADLRFSAARHHRLISVCRTPRCVQRLVVAPVPRPVSAPSSPRASVPDRLAGFPSRTCHGPCAFPGLRRAVGRVCRFGTSGLQISTSLWSRRARPRSCRGQCLSGFPLPASRAVDGFRA